jgi:hypothetical protein
MCEDPLTWWKTHEGQFSNVGFLAKQVFGILGLKLKLKKYSILLIFDSFKALLLTNPKFGLDYHYHQQLA